MQLLERVTALIRANLNDLIDKAEDPEKMVKQLLLDLENQLIQVKTQVAVMVADHQVLLKKKMEQEDLREKWMRKAELAVEKHDDELARAALERVMSAEQLAAAYGEQTTEHDSNVESLKCAYHNLEHKIGEAKARLELLVAQQRRARAVLKTAPLEVRAKVEASDRSLRALQDATHGATGAVEAQAILAGPSSEERLIAMERNDRLDKMLIELKAKKGISE